MSLPQTFSASGFHANLLILFVPKDPNLLNISSSELEMLKKMTLTPAMTHI